MAVRTWVYHEKRPYRVGGLAEKEGWSYTWRSIIINHSFPVLECGGSSGLWGGGVGVEKVCKLHPSPLCHHLLLSSTPLPISLENGSR